MTELSEISTITLPNQETYDIKDQKARAYCGTLTLPATWSGSGPYTQTVTLSGYTVTSKTQINLQGDSTAIQQMLDDSVSAIYIENNNGTLTAYAIGAAPTAAMTVQYTIIEVTV